MKTIQVSAKTLHKLLELKRQYGFKHMTGLLDEMITLVEEKEEQARQEDVNKDG